MYVLSNLTLLLSSSALSSSTMCTSSLRVYLNATNNRFHPKIYTYTVRPHEPHKTQCRLVGTRQIINTVTAYSPQYDNNNSTTTAHSGQGVSLSCAQRPERMRHRLFCFYIFMCASCVGVCVCVVFVRQNQSVAQEATPLCADLFRTWQTRLRRVHSTYAY